MNLQSYVAIYKTFTTDECNKIIDSFNNVEWQKHKFNNVLTNESTTYNDDLDVAYGNDEINNFILNKINACIVDYIETVSPHSMYIQSSTMPRVNKYEVGQNMKLHHDHIHTIFDGTKKGVPILTILGLLNDDFEGGELLLFDDKKINFQAGDVIVFPSNFLYPHAVNTITKGTRYSFVIWAY